MSACTTFYKKYACALVKEGNLGQTAVGGDHRNLEGDILAAGRQSVLHSPQDAAAAGYGHPGHGYTLYIVLGQNGGQLFAVISVVQLGAADEGHLPTDEVLMEIAVGVGGAVGGDEQMAAVKVRGVHRS